MSSAVWQDREIRFDSPDSHLQPRPGEVIISHLEEVEDTKGNSGGKGRLYITNLRVIWTSADQFRVNLSIGMKTISKIRTKKVKSNLRGISEAVYLMTMQSKTQFEFIFTSRVADSSRMFSSLMAIHRAYESSSLYRELVMRGALLNDSREINLLPQEQLYTKLSGVWNLSSDKGNLGTLFITNVRVAWQCKLNDNFNVSIPYLQMKVVKVRDTKFGVAMVLEAGTMVLGFKVDPYEALKKVIKEIQSLHQVYSACPIFGVEYSDVDDEGEGPATPTTDAIQEDVELVNTKQDTLAAYLADPHKTVDRDPVYSPDLGLAIEELPDGYTIADLWHIS